jgi:Protein of unknown function (DUF742)
MPTANERWLDAEAGPVVRPYALTRGRTRPAGERLDLIAIVTAASGTGPGSELGLDPEHLTLLRLCRLPASVADLASGLDLPVGVVRILIADLRERSLVRVHNPIPPARLPDARILQEVVDGLRRL